MASESMRKMDDEVKRRQHAMKGKGGAKATDNQELSSKKKEMAKKMPSSEARKRKDTPESQRLNRIGRAGTKRPEHGEWPQYK